jgi:hypothetical protein
MGNLNMFLVALSAINMADMETAINVIKGILNFMINLTPEERRELRNIGIKRVGYMTGVNMVANDFSNLLPVSFSLADYNKQKMLADQLAHLAFLIGSLHESLDDTRLSLNSILLKKSDLCYGFLKTAAQNDEALSEIVKDLGVVYKHKTPATAHVVTLLPEKTAIIGNVKPRTLFYNKGATVIKFRPGAELSGKVKMAWHYVGPGQATIIPAGWTIIEVTNESNTEEGIVAVRVS